MCNVRFCLWLFNLKYSIKEIENLNIGHQQQFFFKRSTIGQKLVAQQKGLKTDSLCLDCLGGHQDSETNLYKIRPRDNGVKVEDAKSPPDSAINSQMPPPECHSQDSLGNLLPGSLRPLHTYWWQGLSYLFPPLYPKTQFQVISIQ